MDLDPSLTQILTGYSTFGAYLHRFRRRPSPECKCGGEVAETVTHLIPECPIYGIETYRSRCSKVEINNK